VPDGNTSSTGQPPLYYGVAGAVDAVAPGNVLDRLAQVRLVGVLALVALALGVVALARRLAPAHPEWAVTAGLLAGLVPLVGFMAGGVTPDVPMLAVATWAVAAALAFVEDPRGRPGLTLGLLGAALALVKLTTVALVPGLALLVLLALGVAIQRGWPRGATGGVVGLGAGLLVPLTLYVVWCGLSDRSVIPGAFSSFARAEAAPGAEGSGPLHFLNLMWQLYLPRVPGTNDLVPGLGPRDIWLNGFVGRYGWLDYGLPAWVNRVLPWFWTLVALLGVRGGYVLLRRRQAELPRPRRVERIVVGVALVLLLAGVLFSVARADYTALAAGTARFQQPRYLMLALPVAAALVLFALRGTPTRARPYLAVSLVGVAVLHTVASIVATVSRYYA
jgi:4-amino-4-deoxy-L-arabinose transferase-like glycosyltransferase